MLLETKSWCIMGRELCALQNYEEGIRCFDEAIRVDKNWF